MDNSPDMADAVKRLDIALEGAMTRALADGSVPYSQAGVLHYLAGRTGTPTSNRDIESYFGVSNPAVSGLLKRLQAKGFVSVDADLSDQRRRVVRITDSGLAAMEVARNTIQNVNERMLSGFDREEAEQFLHFIERARGNLSNVRPAVRRGS